MFLSLIYAFDDIDFHSENVIACGEEFRDLHTSQD
jgi:lantibiotic modifying enzyme